MAESVISTFGNPRPENEGQSRRAYLRRMLRERRLRFTLPPILKAEPQIVLLTVEPIQTEGEKVLEKVEKPSQKSKPKKEKFLSIPTLDPGMKKSQKAEMKKKPILVKRPSKVSSKDTEQTP